jgi:hypothetical protein
MYDYLTVLILLLQIIVGGVAEKIIVCFVQNFSKRLQKKEKYKSVTARPLQIRRLFSNCPSLYIRDNKMVT